MSEILEVITPAQLLLTCVALGIAGMLAIAHSTRRTAPRNIRRVPRESGNTVPRKPNVRRPNRDAEIRALIADAAPMSADDHERQRRSFAYGNAVLANPHVTREMVDRAAETIAWTDEPTVTSPRGES